MAINRIPPSRILVIGYGNEVRGDDALGPRLARAIEEMRLPGVRVLTAHQLTPELAEPISAADGVVFVDASVDAPKEVQVRSLTPAVVLQAMGHAAHPGALLGLAQALFRHSPPGWWITIPAFDLSYAETLSPQGQAALAAGLEAFQQLWQQLRQQDK